MALKQKLLVFLNKIFLKDNFLIGKKRILAFLLIFFALLISINEIRYSVLALNYYTVADVSLRSSASNCWIVVKDKADNVYKVYDITNYFNMHPGGNSTMASRCGDADATNAFQNNPHSHSNTAWNLLRNTYFIGNLGTAPSPTPIPSPNLTPTPTSVITPTPIPTATPIFSPPPSQSPVPLPSIVGLTSKSITKIVNNAIVWLLGAVASLAILFIVIGGIYYITASGDERRMDTAKNIITYAIMGLFLVAIAYAIIITVNKVVG